MISITDFSEYIVIIIFHITLSYTGMHEVQYKSILPVSISGQYVAFPQNNKDNSNGQLWHILGVGKHSTKAQFYTKHPNTILCKLKSLI